MLYYEWIDVSERIDVNKTSESKECEICHYCYFSDKSFKAHRDVSIGCHDVLKMFINLSNVAALNINRANLCCVINGISKNEAINLLKNVDLTEKSWA